MNKKLVVITGASSGFGKSLAIKFNQAGYPLLLLARRVELLEELNLTNTICEKVDVRNKDEFETAIRKAEEIYGPTDLLINNAGVMLLGHIEDQNPDEWQTMLDVNVMGVLNGMQIVVNKMKENKHGTIINLSSMAGVKATANRVGYCATKFGVSALSEVARLELAAHNVRVMRICPGAVDTELLSHTTSDKIKSDYADWRDTKGIETINSDHIADIIKFAYEMPQGVNIREIQVTDTKQDV